MILVLVVSLVRLYRAGADKPAALVHVAAATVLLLPVAHLAYEMFVLPLLWWWVRELLLRPTRRTALGFAVLVVWWLVTRRAWPDTWSPDDWSALRYGVVFACTYVSVVASCWISPARAGAGGRRTSTTSERHPQPTP
jgi:hypothetical protein